MVQSFVGRVFSSGRKVTPPLCLYIDECQNVLYYGIEDLFAKAGGADVWVHGFAQSVSQLYAMIGKDYALNELKMMDNKNPILKRILELTSKHAPLNKVSIGGGEI